MKKGWERGWTRGRWIVKYIAVDDDFIGPDEDALELIAELIMDGHTSGEIRQETEDY